MTSNAFVIQRIYLLNSIQLQLSKKQKKFSQFFPPYGKSTSNIEYFQKKMTLLGYVFSKLETAKDVVS